MIVIEENQLKALGIAPKVIKKVQKVSQIPVAPTKDITSANITAANTLSVVISNLTKSISENQTTPDLTPIIEAIYNIQETQLNVLQLLEKKINPKSVKSFDFFVARNKHGFIHKITAKES